MEYIFNIIIIITLLLSFDMLGFYFTNKHKLSNYFSTPIGFLMFLGLFQVITLPAQILHLPLFATTIFVLLSTISFLYIKRKKFFDNMKCYGRYIKTKEKTISTWILLVVSAIVAWHTSPQGDSRLYYPMIAYSVDTNTVNAITMGQHFVDGYLTFMSMLNQLFAGEIYTNIVFFSKIFENFLVFSTMYAILSFFFFKNRIWLFFTFLIGLSFGIIMLTPFYNDVYQFASYGIAFACPNGTIILTMVLLPTLFYLSFSKQVELEILLPITLAGFAASSSFLFIIPILFIIWSTYLLMNKMSYKIHSLCFLALPAIFFTAIFLLVGETTNYGAIDQIVKITIAIAIAFIAYILIDLLKWKNIYIWLYYVITIIYFVVGVYLFFRNYQKAIELYSDVIAGSWILPTYINGLTSLFLIALGLFITYHKNKDLFTYILISFIFIGNTILFIGYGTQTVGLHVFTRATILMPLYLAIYYSLDLIFQVLKKIQYKIIIPIVFYVYLFYSPHDHVFAYFNFEFNHEDWFSENPYTSLERYEEEITFLHDFDYPESNVVQIDTSFQLGGVVKTMRPDLEYVNHCYNDCYLFISNGKEPVAINPQPIWKSSNYTMYYVPDNNFWVNYKEFHTHYNTDALKEENE